MNKEPQVKPESRYTRRQKAGATIAGVALVLGGGSRVGKNLLTKVGDKVGADCAASADVVDSTTTTTDPIGQFPTSTPNTKPSTSTTTSTSPETTSTTLGTTTSTSPETTSTTLGTTTSTSPETTSTSTSPETTSTTLGTTTSTAPGVTAPRVTIGVTGGPEETC